MKKVLIVLVVALFTLPTLAQEVNTKSTYYLIRHAEKDRTDATKKDPNLNKLGRERAVRWMHLLSNFGVDTIYSTNYNRTKQTAEPLALEYNLKIASYHPFKLNLEKFLEATKGKNVLVVGHSNTTAAFANKLIGREVYPEIKDNNNANLYIVTIDSEAISHVLIKMKD